MVESIETVVIGAGQAGLATSYFLKQYGYEHIVLDKAGQPGNAWRNERWDSFTFVTPNWAFRLPGGEYDGADPDGYMTWDELVSRFDRYTEKYQLPITYNTRVTAVKKAEDGGYILHTTEKEYHARNVVAANGWFQTGKLPAFASQIPPSILQLHSSQYRNPQALPPGAVLVAGSAQSGAQIAEELYQSGRKVFLATGRAPHAPRRYRGKDVYKWFIETGFTDQTFEQMQFLGRSFVAPMFSGKDGGHALNLHKFYRDGVILLGHASDYADGKITLAPDLKENLSKADMGQKFMLKNIDDYIQRSGEKAPSEHLPVMLDAYEAPEITRLNLRAENINTIIWACGYSYDPSMFQFPVVNQYGIPEAPMGVSANHPGLYFMGSPLLPKFKTGLFTEVARCAAYIAGKVVGKEEMQAVI